MKLYLLTRANTYGYDEYISKTVIARDEAEARNLANIKYAGEGPIWTDNTKVNCQLIPLTEPAIVSSSFNAG